MHLVSDSQLPAPYSAARWISVFAIVFVAYQLPEGLGMHVLHSMPVLSVLMLLFFPIAWWCARLMGFRGFDAWYLVLNRRTLFLLILTFVAAILAKAAALAMGNVWGVYHIADAANSLTVMAILSGMGMTFFPSIAEDILTRGLLMRALPRLSRKRLFILVSATVYVLNHIYRLANGPLEWLMLLSFGLAYAAALFYSESLWSAVGLHWGWNFAGGLFDQAVQIDVLIPRQHPLMSTLMHLGLLIVVVVLGERQKVREAKK